MRAIKCRQDKCCLELRFNLRRICCWRKTVRFSQTSFGRRLHYSHNLCLNVVSAPFPLRMCLLCCFRFNLSWLDSHFTLTCPQRKNRCAVFENNTQQRNQHVLYLQWIINDKELMVVFDHFYLNLDSSLYRIHIKHRCRHFWLISVHNKQHLSSFNQCIVSF